MSGFAARTEPSTGTADVPPRATAMVVGDVTLVAVDVVGVDETFVAAVRAELARSEALKQDGGDTLHVLATHTHAGPCVLAHGLGRLSQPARDAAVRACVEAVVAARAQRRGCRLEWMQPVVPGLAFDRRRLVRSEDATLTAVRWLDGDEVVGSLVSYPCHPTALGPLNRELSPDYPGFVRHSLEQEWGGTCLFATGCAGDLNTGQSPEASYRTGAGDEGRTMADAARFGAAVAAHVLSATWEPVDLAAGAAALSRDVTLEQTPLDEESVEALADLWRGRLDGADPGVAALLEEWIAWAESPGAGEQSSWTGHVSAVVLGEVTVVLLPGEPFLAAARLVDRVLDRVITLGYADDCPGYFPAREDYPSGGYEVVDAHRYYRQPAPFAPGSLETLVEAALEVVAQARR